jgi:hypothetical protein
MHLESDAKRRIEPVQNRRHHIPVGCDHQRLLSVTRDELSHSSQPASLASRQSPDGVRVVVDKVQAREAFKREARTAAGTWMATKRSAENR